MKKNIETWIVISDVHLPYSDKKTIKALEDFLIKNRVDGWLCLGDLLDLNEISSFNKDAPRRRTELLQQSFEHGNKFLDTQQAIVRNNNKDARFVLLEGNHEYRLEDYMDRNEQLSGMLDLEKNLKLKERGIEFIRMDKHFKLGKARFIHGKFTNDHHAKKTVSRYGSNIYYGHTHDVMEFPLESLGEDNTKVGKSLGCLCDYNQKYLKGNPTKWQQAFAIFMIFPDGNYTEHTIRIFKHRFVMPNGDVYDGNK